MYKLLFILALLVTTASADTSQAKVSIEKAWAEMDRAFSRFDARGSVKHMRPDFVMTFANRPGLEVTRDQVIQVLSQKLPQIKKDGGKLQASTKVLSLKKLSESSVKAQVQSEGTEQKSKTSKSVQVLEVREETWLQQGKKWTCQSSHIVKENRI